jgi:hypothetical protein
MSQGVLGWFHSNISGEQSRPTPPPGLFKPGTVGGFWGDYLKKLYATPTGESPQFLSQSTALRDALTRESATQGEQFGQATNAGGFFDSGARLMGLGEIDRNRMASFSQGLTAILQKLEEEKLNAAYPFLTAQLGEYNAHEQAQANASNEQNFRGAQLGQGISGGISGATSGGGGGGYTSG